MFRPLAILLICIVVTTGLRAQDKRFSFTRPKMGSPFTIILYTTDSISAGSITQHCFELVDSLVMIFSDYIDSSELNRLCARAGKPGDPFVCSAPLFDILRQSQYAFQQSSGSFDITLGPITRLWRKARKEKIFPSEAQVKTQLACTGFNKLVLDTNTHTARLQQQGMQLDLGGIGQGYIAQQVIDYLKKQQVTNALVDVSGDIVCTGKPPGSKGWTVAVNVPESADELLPGQLLISNYAVTTSGDVYQFMEHDGKKYSHIVDPATGYGITSQRNVTVIARDGTLADWLTKACSILSIGKAKKLAHRLGASVLIAEMKNGKVQYHYSRGFTRWWKR